MNNFASTAANKLHAARSDTITAGDNANLGYKRSHFKLLNSSAQHPRRMKSEKMMKMMIFS